MGVDEPCASKGVPRRELESVGGSRRWRMKQGEESAAVEKIKYSRGSGTQIFSGTASGMSGGNPSAPPEPPLLTMFATGNPSVPPEPPLLTMFATGNPSVPPAGYIRGGSARGGGSIGVPCRNQRWGSRKAPPYRSKAPNLKAPIIRGEAGFGAVRGATGVHRKRACRVFGGSRAGSPKRILTVCKIKKLFEPPLSRFKQLSFSF